MFIVNCVDHNHSGFREIMKDLNFLAITPCEILIIIWGTVSFFMFLHLFYGYYRIHKEIQTLYHYESADTTQNIRTQFPEFASLEYVIVNHAFPSPMQIGFIHPIILLPTIQYDSKDFYYILKHEMTHYHNHDTWIKLGINIWRCIFWWFPFTYLLYYELDESLELKCDYIVTQNMTASQKADYLSALLHVYESQPEPIRNHSIFTNKATALYKGKDSLLHRFHYIAISKKQHNYTAPVSIVFLMLFLSSYLFVFQSYGQPTYENDNGIYFSQDNACIHYDAKGNYELYINNEFAADLDNTSANKLIKVGIPLQENK